VARGTLAGELAATGEPAGDTWPAAAGAGEAGAVLAGGAAVFFNARLSELPPMLRWAYKTDNRNVIAKKIPASQPVNLTSTLVVCAPNKFSVTAPPKAAPKPSLFGRCMRMTSIISKATIIQIPNKIAITMDIGTGNMAKAGPEANRRRTKMTNVE
jgi:hypothetical protein